MSKACEGDDATQPSDKTAQSEDDDTAGGRCFENLSFDSLEVASVGRSVRSGSICSLHSDEMCSVLCENYNANGQILPDYINGNKQQCVPGQVSDGGVGIGSFMDFTQRQKSVSDKTHPRLKRRSTTDATSMCTSCESISTLNSSYFPKSINSIRHTKMSLARRQMGHVAHQKSVDTNADEYLTPTQKKDRSLSELRQELQTTRQEVSDLESQLKREQEECEQKIKTSIADRDREIEMLREVVEDLRTAIASVTSSHQAEEERANLLEQNVKRLEEEIIENEQKNQELFLRMYTKGQQSAKIERQLQIEEIASANPVAVEVGELMEKLELTQAQLDRWQILRRKETYEGVDVPGTDNEVRLMFMRDSLFHYLTSSNSTDDHLKAMVKVADFTDVQMDKIRKAMASKKKKGKY